MNKLDESLLKHLYIEFRYGKTSNGDKMLFESSWKNKLWEEHGIMNNMDSYTEAIYNYIEDTIKDWDGKNVKTYSFIITEKDFNFDTFFDTIKIPIYITLEPNVNGCKFGGAYISGKSGYKENLYHVEIGNISLEGNPFDILQKCKVTFAHELTHAYEDYSRLSKNKENLWRYSRKRGQYIATKMNDNYDIGTFIYYVNNVEINAQISELKEELIPLMKYVNNSLDAWECIKKTSIYKNIMKLSSTMDGLYMLDSEKYKGKQYDNFRTEVIKAFNETREKDLIEFNFGQKSTKVTNFHQVVKILEKKFNRFKKRFVTQASKIAYDLYEKYGEHGTDSGIIWGI